MVAHEPSSQTHARYEQLYASPDFKELRRRYRGFAFPWTVAFMAWYLIYVLAANWATDFMNTKITGNINVALVFGLLQFVTTFGIAWLYSRHATRQLDPLAAKLHAEFERGETE